MLKLILNVMVFKCGAFGRGLNHEGGALTNGIIVLIKQTPESSLAGLLCHVRTQ